MGMRLSFELTDRDLTYFRHALKQSREAVRDADESEIIDAIRDVLADIRRNEPLPDFVAIRLPQLDLNNPQTICNFVRAWIVQYRTQRRAPIDRLRAIT